MYRPPKTTEASLPNPEMGDSYAIFETLFESSPDPILLTDREGRITRLNAQAEQVFGYGRSELIGNPLEILLPERFRAVHPSHRETYLAQPRKRPMGLGLPLFARRKDGSEFPVDIMLSSVETPDGLAVLSVVRDISERRRIEEALREHEEQFRSVVQGVKDYAIFLLDREGRIASWNVGAENIKGYKAQEIIGQHFSCFYTPEDLKKGKAQEVLRLASEAGRFEDEGWRLRKDGTTFWAHITITALRNPAGEVVGFSKITRDFSEREQAEQALKRSEEHLRALFEFSPDAIVTSDSSGTITEVNSQIEKVFGYKREELVGQSVEMLIPERFRRSHPAHRREYNAHPEKRPMGAGLELYGRRKDGTEFPLDIMLGPVETGTGKVVMSIVRDLSEKKEQEEALRRVELEKRYLEEELSLEHGFEDIIGESIGLKRVLKQAETVAETDVTVLILGETGTGKDLVARAIHRLSARRERTMAKLNCAAIPTGLLESELFGHEKGAFTGAIAQKVGRLELANKGTLFLDEVGDLPTEVQPKLLRALQEKEFERLGGTRTIPVDFRLIAATNRDLGKMVADREFRSDLYYRLRVFPISIPPLRERHEDIPLLVRYFVDKHSRALNKKIEVIPSDVMRALTKWSWPGNIRELENFIERAVILSKGPALRAPLSELETVEAEPPSPSDPTLKTAERDHIIRVLREANGMIGGPDGAAARLGLKRTTLNSKLRKLAIKREDYI